MSEACNIIPDISSTSAATSSTPTRLLISTICHCKPRHAFLFGSIIPIRERHFTTKRKPTRTSAYPLCIYVAYLTPIGRANQMDITYSWMNAFSIINLCVGFSEGKRKSRRVEMLTKGAFCKLSAVLVLSRQQEQQTTAHDGNEQRLPTIVSRA